MFTDPEHESRFLGQVADFIDRYGSGFTKIERIARNVIRTTFEDGTVVTNSYVISDRTDQSARLEETEGG